MAAQPRELMGIKIDIELGDGHTLQFTGYEPDRELNPEAKDDDRFGAIIAHFRADNGEECCGAIMFDGHVQRTVRPEGPFWKVESLDPLTLSPSILCRQCGDHGFIRQGKWVGA